MADIPVYESTAETVVVVTANGQATFNFDFLILFPEQMTVLHGRDDVETALDYPADFSVSGLDEPNGGTVTLNVATLAGDVITMRRVTPIERLNDWQNEGDYKAALVNREQDTMFMIMQELARDAGETDADLRDLEGKSIIAPDGYSGARALPSPSPNRGIIWNADGTGFSNSTFSEAQLKSMSDAASASASAAAGSANAAGASAAAARGSEEAAAGSESASLTYKTQAELAALAAGAPLFTDEPPLASAPSPYLMQVDAGAQVWTHDGSTRTMVGWLGKAEFPSVQALVSFNRTLGPVGTEIVAEGFRYKVAPTIIANPHITTAGGVNLIVAPGYTSIMLEMFGGKGDATGSGDTLAGTDNIPAMNKALDYVRSGSGGIYGSGVTIQGGVGDYAFFSSIKIITAVRIVGASGAGMGNQRLATRFLFPPDTRGIITYGGNTIDLDTGLASGTYADGTELVNIQLVGGGGTDRDAHGVSMRCRTACHGLRISEFGGNAYDIVSNRPGEGSNNVNNWTIYGGRTSNCLNGIYTQGADANAGCAFHVDNSAHLQAGILDRSFLGNYYFGCHENGNATRAKVMHNGQRYRAAQTVALFGDPTPLRTTEPGTDDTIWVPYNITESGYEPWVSGGEYFTGGQKVSTNNNARTTFIGGYSEPGWHPSFILSPAMVLGGTNSAGTAGDGLYILNNDIGRVRSIDAGFYKASGAGTIYEAFSLHSTSSLNATRRNRMLFNQSYKEDGVTPRPQAALVGRSGSSPSTSTYVGLEFYDPALDTLVEAILFNGQTKTATPGVDNTWSLGSASFRFSQVFAANGAINTSDEREKQQIGGIPDEWLDAWGDVQWSRYKWNSAVEEKGDGARWHVGLVAQQVRDAFAAHDLDAQEIGLLCYDEWDDEYEAILEDVEIGVDENGEPITEEQEVGRKLVRAAGSRWGIRYDEAQAMEAAWQRREIERLKSRLT